MFRNKTELYQRFVCRRQYHSIISSCSLLFVNETRGYRCTVPHLPRSPSAVCTAFFFCVICIALCPFVNVKRPFNRLSLVAHYCSTPLIMKDIDSQLPADLRRAWSICACAFSPYCITGDDLGSFSALFTPDHLIRVWSCSRYSNQQTRRHKAPTLRRHACFALQRNRNNDRRLSPHFPTSPSHPHSPMSYEAPCRCTSMLYIGASLHAIDIYPLINALVVAVGYICSAASTNFVNFANLFQGID